MLTGPQSPVEKSPSKNCFYISIDSDMSAGDYHQDFYTTARFKPVVVFSMECDAGMPITNHRPTHLTSYQLYP